MGEQEKEQVVEMATLLSNSALLKAYEQTIHQYE
jgi:hypothetical protein